MLCCNVSIILTILANCVLVLEYDFDEVPDAELGPQSFDELELTVVCLIQHEVAQAHFVACSYQNIGSHIFTAAQVPIE